MALRPIVDEAWGLVAIDERAAGIDFANEVNPEHRIIGNANRLVQVFLNLIRNAVQSTAGEVRVRSRRFNSNGTGGCR